MAEITRKTILSEAERCVCGDREQAYSSPEDNHAIIAALWEIYIRRSCVDDDGEVFISPEDIGILMCLLKIARIASGQKKPDNYVDLAGYAACAGEIAFRQNDEETEQ